MNDDFTNNQKTIQIITEQNQITLNIKETFMNQKIYQIFKKRCKINCQNIIDNHKEITFAGIEQFKRRKIGWDIKYHESDNKFLLTIKSKYKNGETYFLSISECGSKINIKNENNLIKVQIKEDNHFKKNMLEFLENCTFRILPNGFEAYMKDFRYIHQLKVLISEFLMKEPEISITEIGIRQVINSNDEIIINLIKSLIMIPYILKCKNLLHSDIKNDNLSLSYNDSLEGFCVKLSDFELRQILSITYHKLSNNKLPIPYSIYYVRPEIINQKEFGCKIVEERKTNNIANIEELKLNLWASQIYSFGMTILEILQKCQKTLNLETQNIIDDPELDTIYKKSQNTYKEKFLKVLLEEKENIIHNSTLKNIYQLVIYCLDWSPEKKPNAIILSQLSNAIEKSNPEEFREKYGELFKSKINSKLNKENRQQSLESVNIYGLMNFNNKDYKEMEKGDLYNNDSIMLVNEYLQNKINNQIEMIDIQKKKISSLKEENENQVKQITFLQDQKRILMLEGQLLNNKVSELIEKLKIKKVRADKQILEKDNEIIVQERIMKSNEDSNEKLLSLITIQNIEICQLKLKIKEMENKKNETYPPIQKSINQLEPARTNHFQIIDEVNIKRLKIMEEKKVWR